MSKYSWVGLATSVGVSLLWLNINNTTRAPNAPFEPAVVEHVDSDTDLSAIIVTAYTNHGYDIHMRAATNALFFADAIATDKLVIGPVTVDCKTGNVTLKDGVSLDKASAQFWHQVERKYPEMFPQ